MDKSTTTNSLSGTCNDIQGNDEDLDGNARFEHVVDMFTSQNGGEEERQLQMQYELMEIDPGTFRDSELGNVVREHEVTDRERARNTSIQTNLYDEVVKMFDDRETEDRLYDEQMDVDMSFMDNTDFQNLLEEIPEVSTESRSHPSNDIRPSTSGYGTSSNISECVPSTSRLHSTFRDSELGNVVREHEVTDRERARNTSIQTNLYDEVVKMFDDRETEDRLYDEQMDVDMSFMDNTDFQNLLEEIPEVSTESRSHPSNDIRPSTSGYGTSSNISECVPSTSRLHRTSPSVQQTGSGGDNFVIHKRQVIKRKKFGATESTFDVKLNNLENGYWKDQLDTIGNAMDRCLSMATANLHENDRIRVFINQRGLETPIVVPLRPINEITSDTILRAIEKVLQSKSSLQFDSSFEMSIGTIELPRGGAGKQFVNAQEARLKKQSIIRIKNDDNMCLARAICVCIAHKFNDKNMDYMKNPRSKVQKDAAIDLSLKAGVSVSKKADINDVKKFADCLNVQIAVVSQEQMNEIIYKTEDKVCKIYVYHNDDHFDAITNIKGFKSARFYCERCDIEFSQKHLHRCDSICKSCYRTDCISTDPRPCADCNRTFSNQSCYDRHKEPQLHATGSIKAKSICQVFWGCTECTTIVDSRIRKIEDHVCDEMFCKLCKKYYYKEGHICYIVPKKAQKPSYNYLFFDFECSQEENDHKPNFVVCQKTCHACIDKELTNEDCLTCGKREVVFEGADTVTHFCEWLFSNVHEGYTAIAHNAKGYDSVFLLHYLLKNAVTPKVTYSGSKIMYLEVPSMKLRVIDSLNHIPTSLSNFPKTFGLTELHKGHFPHFFNRPENQNYVGVFPTPDYYGVDTMSSDARQKFEQWYVLQEGKVFDFRVEMLNYCRSDVDILRRSCLKFRKLIIDATTPPPTAVDDSEPWGVDPLKYVTIASLCFGIFKHLFLDYCQIARVPAHGITTRDRYSQISIHWLLWEEHKAKLNGKPIAIRHALNGRGEARFVVT